MPASDPKSRPLGALLLMTGGSEVASSALDGAAAHGLDAPTLRMHSSSPFVSLIGRGDASRLSNAVGSLRAAGARCAAVPEDESGALPRLELAGGVAPEGAGVVLRVHGRPAGPPAGVPLLLIVGDVGREEGLPSPSAPRPSDTVRQRILRAVYPVVDVVWSEGRIRIPLRTMAWRGLPGITPSAPSNLLRMLELLVERSGGALLDMGFGGQDMAVDPGPSSHERLEGADAETALHFDRYATASALAWKHGLYPDSAAGQIVVLSDVALPKPPAEIFRARPAPPRSPIPWIRQGKKARVRGRLWPWFSPLAVALVFFRAQPIAVWILALAGLLAIVLGLRWLRARERVRSLPLAKIRSAAMGPVQLAGTVIPTARLITPYSRIPAGWYQLEIQQLRGNSKNEWDPVQKGGSGDIPFRLQDETGSILIQPSGAEVDVPPVTTQISMDTRALEWVIREGASLFVHGFAQRRATADASIKLPDTDDVFVGSAPGVAFLLSHRDRDKETGALTRNFRALVALGFVYLALALILWIARPFTGD